MFAAYQGGPFVEVFTPQVRLRRETPSFDDTRVSRRPRRPCSTRGKISDWCPGKVRDPRGGARRTPPRPLERRSRLPRVGPERDRDPSRWSSVVQSASRPRSDARRGCDADSSSDVSRVPPRLTRLPTRVGPSFPAPSSARADPLTPPSPQTAARFAGERPDGELLRRARRILGASGVRQVGQRVRVPPLRRSRAQARAPKGRVERPRPGLDAAFRGVPGVRPRGPPREFRDPVQRRARHAAAARHEHVIRRGEAEPAALPGAPAAVGAAARALDRARRARPLHGASALLGQQRQPGCRGVPSRRARGRRRALQAQAHLHATRRAGGRRRVRGWITRRARRRCV